ncbi:MAG: GGDEF domain-containing protein [Planctomycetes bacterium]|nr:GGDEF domain-containing protein [Planctomycetota bacterium]
MPRAVALALLAMVPVLVEHGIFRVLTFKKVERELSRELDQRADLIESRIQAGVESYLIHADELSKATAIEKLQIDDATLPIAERNARREAANRRLTSTTGTLPTGVVARVVDRKGTVLASSVQENNTTNLESFTIPDFDHRADGPPVLCGRETRLNGDNFEFFAPIQSSAPVSNSRTGARLGVLLWVPAELIERTPIDYIKNDGPNSRLTVFDRRGICLIDSSGALVGRKVGVPTSAQVIDWQTSDIFGKETDQIIRSVSMAPQLLSVLKDYQYQEIRARVKNISFSKLDILYVRPVDRASGEFSSADALAIALSIVCGLAVFLYIYGRTPGVSSRLESSIWPPALSALGVFAFVFGTTIYASYAIDDKGRESSRAFSELVERSLTVELQNAIAARAAYFDALDDRLASAADLEAEFLSIRSVAEDTFPEGTLALWDDLDNPDREALTNEGRGNPKFTGTADLPAGLTRLEHPKITLDLNNSDGASLLFDAPFRHANPQSRCRIMWSFDLAKLCNVAFTPANTGGFDVFLININEPSRSLAPRRMLVPSTAAGKSIFRLPKDGSHEFKIALMPRVDLFGTQTARGVVLYLGLLLAMGGAVAMAIVVSALGMYRRASRVDPLTGLYNRIGFSEILAREVARADRHQRALTVAILDLDYFKQVNDSHGHATGDEVLRRVSDELVRLTRSSDTIFRYGGEEFAVILPETPEESALIVIERVRENFAKNPISETVSPVTFSCGVAQWDGVESTDRFLARADAALYQAKKHGRNRVLSAQILKIAESLQMKPAGALEPAHVS